MAEDMLDGAGLGEVETTKYLIGEYTITEPMTVGQKYTLSVYVDELVHDGSYGTLAVYDGGGWFGGAEIPVDGPGTYTKTFIFKVPFPEHTDPSHISLYNTPPNDSKARASRISHVTLAAGDEPAGGGWLDEHPR